MATHARSGLPESLMVYLPLVLAKLFVFLSSTKYRGPAVIADRVGAAEVWSRVGQLMGDHPLPLMLSRAIFLDLSF
jgi:hypothetical protein